MRRKWDIVVHGAQQVPHLATDLYEQRVEASPPVYEMARAMTPLAADLSG